MNRSLQNHQYAVHKNVASTTRDTALFLALVSGVISMVLDVYWLSALGVSAFTFYLVRLILDAGKDIPIESLMLTIASVQWIIGPILAYAGYSDHYKYYMYVPEEEYMMLAVPGVILFSIGLYSFRSRNREGFLKAYASVTKGIVNRNRKLPFYLIGIGFLFSFLSGFSPQSLAFPVYILSNVKYIGLIYVIFSDHNRNRTVILVTAFLLTFLSSLKSGMFHDLLLWSAFIGLYVAYIKKPALGQKLFVLAAGLVFIFVIQAVKSQYREMLWESGRADYLSMLTYSVGERFGGEEDLSDNNTERMVIRMNQGWIISRIMERVPENTAYANGETVVTAVKATLLPRFLFPDKPIAGGKANYEKYTGYILHKTSMGISLLGEAYINFGVEGAWVFMLVIGVVFSYIINRVFLLALKYPTIWLWMPLILLHLVKAETELLVQLNFLVKSIIMVLLFIYINKKFLKIKL